MIYTVTYIDGKKRELSTFSVSTIRTNQNFESYVPYLESSASQLFHNLFKQELFILPKLILCTAYLHMIPSPIQMLKESNHFHTSMTDSLEMLSLFDCHRLLIVSISEKACFGFLE